jgi:hypothetical protein
MLAKMLKAGDEYRDLDGVVQVTVILDAQPDGINPVTGKPQVVTGVRYRDGSNLRWFDADDEVPYTRPEKKD